MDQVLQVYRADIGMPAGLTNVAQAAEGLVVRGDIVAFRTDECAQGGEETDACCEEGGSDLNGDDDPCDEVLQVFAAGSGELVNTGQAVTPCRFEACDPRVPYRVAGDTVTFLTLEADQGEQDLDGNGDAGGIVLQTFNVRAALAERVESSRREGAFSTLEATDRARDAVASVSAGICSVSGTACASNDDCSEGGRCFVPPGQCIEKLSNGCTCEGEQGCTGCAESEVCIPRPSSIVGDCHAVLPGACTTDLDCASPAFCRDAALDIARMFGPLSPQGDGRQVFLSAGEERELIIAGAPDTDGDGVADPFDNCPHRHNAAQADENGNSVGDACDLTTLITEVSIDIKPDGEPNSINPRSKGVVPVALLGAGDFNAAEVVPSTLRFGREGATVAGSGRAQLEDLDGDGLVDLLAQYPVQETGIAPGDTKACLSGEFMDGMPFEGCDSIRTVGGPSSCGLGFELALLVVPVLWAVRRRRQRGRY